jgi:hypothetical protein
VLNSTAYYHETQRILSVFPKKDEKIAFDLQTNLKNGTFILVEKPWQVYSE